MVSFDRLLAFDTSTDVMSIAVGRTVDGVARLWEHSAAGGAQASATLIPAIMDLMAQAELGFADLDAIAFGCGPGAFTGLRTACSVAQGLAFGARPHDEGPGVPVLPVDSLLALAEEARYQAAPGLGALRVLAMLDARMDEIYAACFAYEGGRWEQQHSYPLGGPQSLVLPGADWSPASSLLAGNVFAAYSARLQFDRALPRVLALPTAGAMLRLAPALLAAGCAVRPEQALPTYIRDKVAQTVSERAANRAAAPTA